MGPRRKKAQHKRFAEERNKTVDKNVIGSILLSGFSFLCHSSILYPVSLFHEAVIPFFLAKLSSTKRFFKSLSS